jgi:hypothetical protein
MTDYEKEEKRRDFIRRYLKIYHQYKKMPLEDFMQEYFMKEWNEVYNTGKFTRVIVDYDCLCFILAIFWNRCKKFYEIYPPVWPYFPECNLISLVNIICVTSAALNTTTMSFYKNDSKSNTIVAELSYRMMPFDTSCDNIESIIKRLDDMIETGIWTKDRIVIKILSILKEYWMQYLGKVLIIR